MEVDDGLQAIRVRLQPGSICLLMVWLLPAGQGGFTAHRACRGRTHVMALLHLNSPRHCCI